jgi:hypothetical protein
MNHLVYLDARAGELEKILSGVKTMLVREFDSAQSSTYPVKPGDSLYFLKDHDDCAVRVKATAVRILHISKHGEENLTHALKEMQPRLHLTEDQYNYWAAKQQVLLVEFGSACKIKPFQVASHTLQDRSGWISFEEFSLIMD